MRPDPTPAERLLAGEDPHDPEACLDADPVALTVPRLRAAAAHWRERATHYRRLGEYSDYPPTYRQEMARSHHAAGLAAILETAADQLETLP